MGNESSIHLEAMDADKSIDYKADEAKWDKLMGVRDEVLKVLEGLRQEDKIASNQEASVKLIADGESVELLNNFGKENFAALCIISEVSFEVGDSLKVEAAKSNFEKCARCWNYWESVGSDSEYGDLCGRCVEVVKTPA